MNRISNRPNLLLAIRAVTLVSVAALGFGCFRSPEPRLVEWPFDPSYASLDRALAKNATVEGFDYEELARDPGDIKILKLELAEVSKEEFEALGRNAKLAFLINAHNAYAIDRILRDYPVDSIEETRLLGSALEARDIRLAGRKWSLIELREAIMGPAFKDSRAVFLLNWGMRGCAPLPGVAATGENLDALLERQTYAFIQNEDYNQFRRRDRRFVASPLLETYREEIERDYTTLHLFIERFSQPEVAANLRAFPPRIVFRSFDTAINDAVVLPDLPQRDSASR